VVQRTYRFEIKYRLSLEQAAEMRAWIARLGHLSADEHGEGGSAAYNVHSLYLDTRDWAIYQETRAGLQQRYKVRARCYAFTPDAPIFLEVKHRTNEFMWKTRAEVVRSEAIRLVNGQVPLTTPSSPALENFRGLLDRRRLYPRVWVTYRRHAYVGGARDLVRVTFDTHICAAAATKNLVEPPRWSPLPEVAGMEVLELKYTGSYPKWTADMVRVFDLERRAMSKFRHGVDLLFDMKAPDMHPDPANRAAGRA
jgi:hypothetical protein